MGPKRNKLKRSLMPGNAKGTGVVSKLGALARRSKAIRAKAPNILQRKRGF